MVIKRLIRRVLGNRTPITTGFKAWNRKHPNDQMTEDQYVAYRKQKERRRKNNELR